MKEKKLRLRGYVIPTIFTILILAIFYSGYKIWELVDYNTSDYKPVDYIDKSTTEKIYPTISVQNEIIKPYVDESVSIAIPYYNVNSSDQEQQNSLIYYENIYMQNTGIMYVGDNEFNIVSVLDGKVKNIKDDTIMGKIVEIEHSNNLITIYQSLANTNLSIGQEVKQGEIIGLSGKNEIVDNSKFALHFEVYKNGELINPEDFYKLSVSELNE